ncbi:MAG: glycerol kinase [Actinobacteria bacterium]|nr:glycerol kinase [Actinomycetota bacterium]
MTYIVAIDAGTTGVRSRAVFPDGRETVASYLEFTQYFPAPGLVEHDAEEIWDVTRRTLLDVIARVGTMPATIGITNQRETIVAWDRATGKTFGRAIVWQDRRTAQRCLELAPHLPTVRATTGLVLDPYFSATKIEWMLRNGVKPTPTLAFGTVDSWLLWKLTDGAVFATDESNASRTMLWDITAHEWSREICDLLGVPFASLPEVRDSSGRFGVTSVDTVPSGIPISGIAGDQQAALFGQACFAEGDAKNTYGTGSFVLMNVGPRCPAPSEGMLTTVAWRIAGQTTYAVEGAIFVTGAAVQWLRDGLGIIRESNDIETLAARVDTTGGVVFVPALTGLGSPWWDAEARGAVFGITRGTTAAHLALATLEATAFQTRDVVEAMTAATGIAIRTLRVDGGAAGNDRLMQIQADQLGIVVERPVDRETTAVGAALLAGLAEGVWESPEDAAASRRIERRFEPNPELAAFADVAHAQWREGLRRVTPNCP